MTQKAPQTQAGQGEPELPEPRKVPQNAPLPSSHPLSIRGSWAPPPPPRGFEVVHGASEFPHTHPATPASWGRCLRTKSCMYMPLSSWDSIPVRRRAPFFIVLWQVAPFPPTLLGLGKRVPFIPDHLSSHTPPTIYGWFQEAPPWQGEAMLGTDQAPTPRPRLFGLFRIPGLSENLRNTKDLFSRKTITHLRSSTLISEAFQGQPLVPFVSSDPS